MFSLTGRGPVVAALLHAGPVRDGDVLLDEGTGAPVRVLSVDRHPRQTGDGLLVGLQLHPDDAPAVAVGSVLVGSPGPTAQDAVAAVLAWLGAGPGAEPRWRTRVYRDAWWVAPEPRQRGDAAYLVRRGTVRPVVADGRATAARVHDELVAEQDG